MMGGGVKGGQIVGKYPDGLKEGSPLNIGRGRIIPTTVSTYALVRILYIVESTNTDQTLFYCKW